MRRTTFNVSLLILVPFIVAGTAVLALLSVQYLPYSARDPGTNLVLIAAAVGIAAFGACAALLYVIIQPVRRFVKTAASTGVIPAGSDNRRQTPPMSELEEYQAAFEQVGMVLSRLDARALFPQIVGHSRTLLGILGQVLKVAPTSAAVLITGESGTGKELIAQAIHTQSIRRDGPLIIVNCAAIPENLLESELFGHEKGAFTGAAATKPGRFEQAHNGTLFLDEIGDMPSALQAKILRVLETGSVERVGGLKPIRAAVRIVAATNRNLQEMIRQGDFREDLFHRLNVFPLHLPTLRQRREDIALLAEHFLAAHAPAVRLSLEALNMLLVYNWPGNIRELHNSLERAAVLTDDGEIRPEHFRGLPVGRPAARDRPGNSAVADNDACGMPGASPNTSLDERLAGMERALIIAALTEAGGIQAKAARRLGIKERSLWHRIKKYAIDPQHYKNAERGTDGAEARRVT